jgi:hypothetical protein
MGRQAIPANNDGEGDDEVHQFPSPSRKMMGKKRKRKKAIRRVNAVA